MFFDGLFGLAAIVLAVNGWHRGLLRSWRGPIAMVLATLIVQHFYIDFSTWIVSRLLISPEAGVMIGYLILWFSLESILEIVLAMVIKDGVKKRPTFFDRMGGAVYGLVKALIIILLPLMAISVDLKIPSPPPDKSGLQFSALETSGQAILVPGFKKVAVSLVPLIGKYVVSQNAPSFTPVFDTVENESGRQAEDRERTQKEIQNLLK